MHAIILLVELNDEKSLDLLQHVLRQDHDYLRIWFGDFLTNGYWVLLYPIANKRQINYMNSLLNPKDTIIIRLPVSIIQMITLIYMMGCLKMREVSMNWVTKM